MKLAKNIGIAAVLTIALSVAGSGVAQAAEEPAEAATTAFDSAQEALGLSTDDATTFNTGVDVTSSDDSVTTSLGDFRITVSADAPNTDTTVLPNGARVMSLLENGQQTTRFNVDLPESTTLRPNGDGYLLVAKAEGTSITLGQIQAPWAVDRDGNRVATTYEYSGGTLTQRLHGSDIAYPVVADPTITVGLAGASDGPGTYWNMTGAQAKALGAITVGTIGGAVAAGCLGAAKIPRVGGIVRAVCTLVGAPTLTKIWGQMSKIMRSTAFTNSACYQVKILPTGNRFHKVDQKNCA